MSEQVDRSLLVAVKLALPATVEQDRVPVTSRSHSFSSDISIESLVNSCSSPFSSAVPSPVSDSGEFLTREKPASLEYHVARLQRRE